MSSQVAYLLLYLEVNLISFFLLLIIRYKTLGLSAMFEQRNFSMTLDAQMLLFLSDAFCMSMESGVLHAPGIVLLLAKTVYFLSTVLVCYFWFIYFEYLQESPLVKNRREIWKTSALVWVAGALLIANLFAGFYFSVDGAGVYHRGMFFGVQYILSYIFVLFSCTRAVISLVRRQNYAKRNLLISLALFPVLPGIAGILQYLYPELPLVCATLALESLLMYLNWLEQMISIDPLTRLNNRKQLEYHFQQWAQGGGDGVPLYLMIIDANKFKSINDTYGHIEGDAALMRIAEAMRRACRDVTRRANIARYGGDEFVIFVASDEPEQVETLRRRINEILAELNREANAPYPLSVSIGVTRADASLPLKELIAKADEQLYEEKKHR
ncbi:MAG: GGDEF domain-containing protein [Ruminococcaceae bacterium]|nr:GGDEF domain-containing protein [Oscillospiraceae bacterium]